MLAERQNMCNSEAVDVTLMMSKLLKWIRLQTCKWTTTIMCQTIKQGFPNHGIDKINRQRRKDKQKQWL